MFSALSRTILDRVLRRSFRLPRVWSNSLLRRLAPSFSGEAINVSGWDDRDKEGGAYRTYFTNASRYYVSNFRGYRGVEDSEGATDFVIDLEAPLDPQFHRRFDVVFNHTTLEHILDVNRAIENLCNMSRDVVILVVPFAQEMHFTESYGDFWRFTPMALRSLLGARGFGVVFEAASPHSNAGIYLLVLASRQPESWRGRLPAPEPVRQLGTWIGETWPRRLLGKAAAARQRLRKG